MLDRSGPRFSILLVEDHRDSVELMATALGVLGHEVAYAYDGADALLMLETLAPDVVVTDIGLPEVDGFELARRIRAMPRLAGVPIIAVTGYGTETDMACARDAGIDRHLLKPVSPSQLLQTIVVLARARGAAA